MGVVETVRRWVWDWLLPGEYMQEDRRTRLESMQMNYQYYQGNQKRFIKRKTGQADDNLVLNFTGLVVDRSVSLLVGGGVKFDLPGERDDELQGYIDTLWDANRRDILLHKAAQYASIFNTGYFKIVPNGLATEDRVYHRILALDPRWMMIETAPEDVDTVMAYDSRYRVTIDGKDVNRRERTEAQMSEQGAKTWLIRQYEADGRGIWREIAEPIAWPYSFAPIVHWQNLPEPGSPYGASDIEDVMELQDRINYISSNISRIIRYHAHPKTWLRGQQTGNTVSWGADQMVELLGSDAMVSNLEMQSDLSSSAAYLMMLRQALFDVSRTVDVTSLADKMGALTNFGLRVLYQDALAKLGTKQELMGGALMEVNKRIMMLDGMAETDPGVVVWPDNLPRNEREDLEAARIELDAGLVSKATLASERGRDWGQEVERMQEEQGAGANIGALLLDNFTRGG